MSSRSLRRYGWETAVEFTFNHFGERGSVDVLAFHAAARVLLIVEVKSRLTDLQAFLASFGRKVRLVPGLVTNGARLGQRRVGSAARRHGHEGQPGRGSATSDHFATELPGRSAEVTRWLRDPDGPIAAIWFVELGMRAKAHEAGTCPPPTLG